MTITATYNTPAPNPFLILDAIPRRLGRVMPDDTSRPLQVSKLKNSNHDPKNYPFLSARRQQETAKMTRNKVAITKVDKESHNEKQHQKCAKH